MSQENYGPLRVGVSMTATWSWGAAVAVAIAVMHTKGFEPYLAWAGANMLALPLFGIGYVYFPRLREWSNLLPMLLLWTFVGFFAVIMNLSALRTALSGGVDIVESSLLTTGEATSVVMAFGLLITGYIYFTGLRGSMRTDVYQFVAQVIGVVGIILVGVTTTGIANPPPMHVGDQSDWMVLAVLGLLTGCFASGMQWQRIEYLDNDRDRLKATMFGGALFAAFLTLVTIAGYFFWTGAGLILIPFGLAVFAVATSTADSGSALLQYLAERAGHDRRVGSVATLIAVLVFPIAADYGLTAIWTFYAGVRYKVILGLLILTTVYLLTSSSRATQRLSGAGKRYWVYLER